MQSGKRREREDEADVWLPRDKAAKHNYVTKHKQRDKGLEVVFDPSAHKCVWRHPAPAPARACICSAVPQVSSLPW